MTKNPTKIAAAVAAAASTGDHVLNIPKVFRCVLVNFTGNAGKTTIARHVFEPILPNVELVRVETINSSGSSEADVELTGNRFDEVAKKLYMARRHTLVDIGSSNVELVKQHLYRIAGSHRYVDMWVVPCMPNTKMSSDTVSTLKELIKIGVKPERITVLKNKVNDVDKMDQDFADLTAVTRALGVRVIDRPLLEFDLFSDMDSRPGSLDDVLADKTDYEAAMRAAADAGDTEAAEEATDADFRRMTAESAVANIQKLRADIFGTVAAPAAVPA